MERVSVDEEIFKWNSYNWQWSGKWMLFKGQVRDCWWVGKESSLSEVKFMANEMAKKWEWTEQKNWRTNSNGH